MARIGFVGLGVMGGGVARRLLEAGHEVTGYNRTPGKADALVALGMHVAKTPREAAERSDAVFSMVTNTKALAAVTEGPDGILAGLGPGKVYIDMSTVSPSASRELADRVAERGAAMLDAPVSGSVISLEQGTLSVIVGGETAVFERVEPILRDIGPTVTHVGGNGQAVLMKIATNLSLAVQMLAFSEGVLLAEKGGISRENAVQVMTNSAIASPMVKYRGPFVLGMPDEAWFDCNMMQKDMVLALDLGRELDVPLPTTATTNEYLTAARGLGLDQHDFAVMFDVLARLAGLEAPVR
jgi:3-hydroxyisobutyrate dehydrogenase-like beta-hydroxyacid dehydrogenase